MRIALLFFLVLRGLWAQPLVMKPKEALVPCGQTIQFRIPGQDPKSFRWQADRGKVDETGLFTAPSQFGPCRVTANEWQDVNRSVSAEVQAVEIHLRSQPEIFLKPREEGRIQIQLDFRGGEMDRKLLWAFLSPNPDEADAERARPVIHDGRVDATGWLRAPSAEGSYAVRITLATDPRISTTTLVRVFKPRPGRVNESGEPVVVTVQPAKVEANAGDFTPFSIMVSGAEVQQTTWSVVEGPKDGEVGEQGVFRASSPGTYRLRATSVAYPECWGEAEVMVKSSVQGVLKAEDAPKEEHVGAKVVPGLKGGYILLGGWTGTQPSGDVFLLDLEAKTLKAHMSLQVPRTRCLATRLSDGTWLVSGGIGGNGKAPLRETERLDIERKASWRVGSPRWFHIGGVLQALPNGRALLVGGCEPGGQPCGAEIFDPATATFRILDERPWPRHCASQALKDGRILILGGELNGRAVALMWSFDPGKDTFTPFGKLAQARSRFTITLQWDEKEAVVMGGRGAEGTLATVERVDLTKGTSSPGGRLTEPRERHAALLLPTGQTLVFGGGKGTQSSKILEDWNPDGNTATIRDRMELGAWLPVLYLNPDGGVFVNGLADPAPTKVALPAIWHLWD